MNFYVLVVLGVDFTLAFSIADHGCPAFRSRLCYGASGFGSVAGAWAWAVHEEPQVWVWAVVWAPQGLGVSQSAGLGSVAGAAGLAAPPTQPDRHGFIRILAGS